MSKATKIDANTWQYRGFAITASHTSRAYPGTVCKTRQGVVIQDPAGCPPRFADAGLWWRPTLAAAVEIIDEWYERADSGTCSECSRIPGRIAAARASLTQMTPGTRKREMPKFDVWMETGVCVAVPRGTDASNDAGLEVIKAAAVAKFREMLDNPEAGIDFLVEPFGVEQDE